MELNLRPPAVAGQFYPGEKKELEAMINNYLAQAEVPEIGGEIFGLVLPHAGYIFSGQIAGYGFKAIAGKKFDTVIVIGDSHYEYFDGVSIWPAGFWETPLGKIEIDQELAEKILSSSDRFIIRDSAHLFEHSVEVELPFLQKTLRNFKILPIIFGSEDRDWQNLAEAILGYIKNKKVLIIISSDLSHYLSYEEAKETDQKTLKSILNLQTQNLEVCAKDSVKTLIEITKNLKGKVQLLKYANSGDTAGDKLRVVGYGAVAFYFPSREKREGHRSGVELLHIVKTSVEDFINKGKTPEFKVESEKLKEKRGVFVTIKKQNKLRGCIGCLESDRPLYQTVSQMALRAGFEDPRFPPLTKEELPELRYEISVLGPLKKIRSLQEIRLGVHGVQIVAGGRTGLFLPQVATENNWDLETFLDNLMLKAGLWPNYWRENPVNFYVFEVEIFSQ